jgi:hypothetical protein
MNDFETAGNAVQGRRRIWVPLAVVGVLLVMIAAEAVFAKSQPDGEELVSGSVVEFGADRQASVQVGDGWTLDEAASDANAQLVLTRGDMVVELSSVVFPAKTTPAAMWTGMDRLLSIERHAGTEVWLDNPSEIDTSAIQGGLSGSLQIGNRVGSAFVLPDADGAEAVEAKVLAPIHANDDEKSAATQLIDSIAFQEES